MEYLPGKDNSLLDALSRYEWREQMVSTGAGGPQPQRSKAKEGVLSLGAGGCKGPPLTEGRREEGSLQDAGGERSDTKETKSH